MSSFKHIWILHALVIHVLLLGSIFVIYFRSPVITGLKPQPALPLEPPAQRLVLIVTDGLRAESFFRDNCKDVPELRKIMQKQGLVGISHTRVPTESRPGHIAMIAGLYEDPSAVFTGWKENPIDFDTLFNRSSYTYAWGSHDVLSVFSKVTSEDRIFIDSYEEEVDFSGRTQPYEWDDWVFERVELLLRRKGAELQQQKRVVFFLHLLGLDTAGHVYKPGSELFLKNLHHTEAGIAKIYESFERTFRDGRTVYLLTADHGMTNAGSHGAGDPMETQTPFFFFGAGIKNNAEATGGRTVTADTTLLQLHELEQGQMAPLMSALLGVAPPTNNFAKLPLGYLNTSRQYEAYAAHSNALQLLSQFEQLLQQHQRGFFSPYLRSFSQLNEDDITLYVERMQQKFEYEAYDGTRSIRIMDAALKGIAYYQGYYRNALLGATTLTFLFWLIYLLQLLLEVEEQRRQQTMLGKQLQRLLAALAILLLIFVLLQNVPYAIAFYLLLPICTGWFVVHKWSITVFNKQLALPIPQMILLIICAELLVFSLFERRLISLGFLCFALASNYGSFYKKDIKFVIWLLLIFILAAFPMLPPAVGYTNNYLLFTGMLLCWLRPTVIKAQVSFQHKLCAAIALINAAICIYQHSNQIGISILSQIISWSYLLYALVSICLNPVTLLRDRLQLIYFNISISYCLLCTSYEALFVLMLVTELMLSLCAQQSSNPTLLEYNTSTATANKQMQSSFRLAFVILLYTFFAFYGTGHSATVSSFDVNIIRCFITTFSPFIMMLLVIVKLLLPVLLNFCIIYGVSTFARAYERQIFICVLLLCDVMGLNFLFLVRNTGSWLEIGTSISHFVIMEATTLILLLITFPAKALLRLKTATLVEVKLK